MQLYHQIFEGIPSSDLKTLFDVVQLQIREYPKGSLLLSQDEENSYIRILKQGNAHAVRYTSDGREVDFAYLQAGDLFADALALSLGHRSPVSIYADCDCTVAMFSYGLLLESRHPYACHVLKNLAEELAEKFFALQQRLHYITQPSLREKIMVYLNDCKQGSGEEFFLVPLDRKAMASFLCSDRSALCRELSALKRDGIIDFYKNRFRIL